MSEFLEALSGLGEVREAGANAPILLEDPTEVWILEAGRADVFAVDVIGGRAEGTRDYLFTVDEGGVLFGMKPEWADEVGLLAVGHVGARARRVTRDEFERLAPEHRRSAGRTISRYVENFAGAVSRRSSPRFDVLLESGLEVGLPSGSEIGSKKRTVWIEIEEGTVLFDGWHTLPVGPEDSPFPLAAGGWVYAKSDVTFETLSTRRTLDTGRLFAGLDSFNRVALEWADVVLKKEREAVENEIRERIASNTAAEERGLNNLAGVLTGSVESAGRGSAKAVGDLTYRVASTVARMSRLSLTAPGNWERAKTAIEKVRAIARASSISVRKVVLSPQWWERDHGPLLAFLREEHVEIELATSGDRVEATEDVQPLAQSFGGAEEAAKTDFVPVSIEPLGPSSYQVRDLRDESTRRIDADVAAELAPFALQFYRGLPLRALGLTDIWKFLFFGIFRDVRALLVLALAGSILGLLTPVLTGHLFDTVIPTADLNGLWTLFIALSVATFASLTMEFSRGMAGMRVTTKVSSSLQMAVFDRMVRLPLPFFSKFTAGDLEDRASGVNEIGDALGGTTLTVVLDSIVSMGAYILLFVYSPTLALVATAILIVNVAVSLGTARFMLKYARAEQEAAGRLSGFMLQLLEAVPKIRVAAAEKRAFGEWATAYRAQRAVAYKTSTIENHLGAFNAVLGIASTMVIYLAYTRMAFGPGPQAGATAAAASAAAGLTTGQFIAFSAAFGTFMSSAISLSGTLVGLIDLIPTWERAKPILDEVPEVSIGQPDPGTLKGRIEVHHLSFRYGAEGPLVLDDVSIEAAPGEFVAIVGPSGAGKSTLLRVLLGFEQPDTQSVFYDGQDLSGIDRAAVRRQIGVVLQSSRLTAGDIHSNIVGSGTFTEDHAWAAAKSAGLESDLRKMPMGLHTVVSEGAGSLSGGQKQRILIARALVHRPRILFFDEATSAMDNRTQAQVSESLDKLHATRVVIAHRLSTIRDADRIYVMDGGRVVQSGTFDELIEEEGLFADLAARQEA